MEKFTQALNRAIEDFLCWIFFPSAPSCVFHAAQPPFDEEARRMRVAFSYFSS